MQSAEKPDFPEDPRTDWSRVRDAWRATKACVRYGCWPNRTTGLCNRCGNVAR